jgi:hypothetical protein
MKSKIDVNKLNNSNDRKDLITNILDKDVKDIFNILNDNLHNKNLIDFMNILQKNSKDLAISLSQLDKKKEKVVIDTYSQELTGLIGERMNMLGKTIKKDYIALAVDICLSALLKKGYMVKLPYEPWSISICANLLSFNDILHDFKPLIMSINEVLSLNEDEYVKRELDIIDLLTKLYNSY